MANNKFLDLTGLQNYDGKIKAHIDTKDAATLQSAKEYADSLGANYDPAGTAQTKVQELANGAVKSNTDAITVLNGADTVEGSVAKQVKDAKTEVEGKIGTLTELDTTAQTDLVSAINEVRSAIDAGGTEAQVTINTATTTEGMAKSYTVKQGSNTVGVIDIPTSYTDTVIDSKITTAVANAQHLKREIVESLPEVEAANADTIYMVAKEGGEGDQQYDEYMLINGAFEKIGDSTVDLTNYATKEEVNTAKSEAISTATTDATSKANQALTDAKAYADGLAVNYATAAQGAKADTALQQADVTTGTANGTIAVKGTDVAVKGLGDAAYMTAGAAEGNVPVNGAALGTTANVPVVTNAEGKLVPHASGALGTAAFADTGAFDAAGTAQSKVDELASGQVATNTSDITDLKGRVTTLEGNTFTAITPKEIEALFAPSVPEA